MREYKSLTVNTRIRLDPGFEATWECDNPLVVSLGNGWFTATQNVNFYSSPNSVANIIASEIAGERTQDYRVTIVPWNVGRRKLNVVDVLEKKYVLKKHSGTDYFYASEDGQTELYRTTDFVSFEKMGDLPEREGCPMIITPFGYFMHGIRSIFKSTDLATWTHCFTKGSETSTTMKNLCFKYDSVADKVYVFTGEYQGDSSYRPNVYRGTIDRDGTELWETILEFKSRDEGIADPLLTDACYHIHAVQTDDQTGAVWVATGDYNNECRIMRTTDYGNTWQVVGFGSQEWRTLDIWWDNGYVTWGMDSGTNSKVFRFPYGWLTEKDAQQRDAQKSTIATLDAGSLWYTVKVKEQNGDFIRLLCCANEGKRRDHNARVFAIKNNSDGTVLVDEAYVVASSTPDVSTPMLQFRPYIQDSDEKIYLTGRETDPETTWVFQLRSNFGTHHLLNFTNRDNYRWI